MRRTLTLALSISFLLSLPACDQAQKAIESAKSATEASSNTQERADKFNEYSEAFNKLIDDNWGVSKMAAKYEEIDIPGAKPSDSINFPENMTVLETAIESLKRGRAGTGDHAETADAAVDKLLPAAEKLLAQWKTLEPYFSSKAYREDKLAKAKSMHADLVASYKATLDGIQLLDAALTDHQRARNQAEMDSLKSEGNMAGYHTVHSMQLADLLVTATQKKDLATAEKLLPELEASVAELTKAGAALPQTDQNKSEIDSIQGRLNAMIGDYREFKQSKRDSYVESMVGAYNDAIGDYNDVDWSSH